MTFCVNAACVEGYSLDVVIDSVMVENKSHRLQVFFSFALFALRLAALLVTLRNQSKER
jgi:ABC-type bacteriocin/lantibiotic exporter with double-glycine peptidase domain